MKRRDCLLALPALLLPAAARALEPVEAARKDLTDSIARNDLAARIGFYSPDAVSLPEYQPALHGSEVIRAYHEALGQRHPISHYACKPLEVLDLGRGMAFETGTFEIGWADGATEPGKYVNVWQGSRLKADAWGYFRPLSDPQSFYIALPQAEVRKASNHSAIGKQLEDLNWRNAEAVQRKDVETQIRLYTDDAIFMPFADMPKSGIDAIAAHLRRYVQNGSGATFDTVEVWNDGFEDFEAHVVEYSRFKVQWRAGTNSGVTTGGGIRLWRKMPDGQLKVHRQIGTHYFKAA